MFQKGNNTCIYLQLYIVSVGGILFGFLIAVLKL